MSKKLNVGIYLFENMTMLDGYAPLQVLAFVEQFNTFTFAKEKKPVLSDCGAVLTPHYGFDDCPAIDILVMPGAANVLAQMTDPVVQEYVRDTGSRAKYVTSVCTGALILAEAGLYQGYKATTHWQFLDYLKAYPDVEVVRERVVVDRNRISGGGVTAGLDFALTLVGEVVAPEVAQVVQLLFEYNPQPPFNAGSPETAPDEVLKMAEGISAELYPDLVDYIHGKHAG